MTSTKLPPGPSSTTAKIESPEDLPLDHRTTDTLTASVEGSVGVAPATSDAPLREVPREQPPHRQVFLDTHPGSPWHCYFCGDEVDELHVHHRDGDHDNNTTDNLVATHGDCHAHHHRTGLEKFTRPPKASALRIAAGSLDDIEGLRKSIENQRRGLTAHNLLDAKAEKLIEAQLEHIKAMERAATLALKHAVRAHPLADWIKETPGISEKGIGRLLAAIGEPAYNAAADRPRRGPAELWAYCGYAPGQKRKRGQKSNWNAEAKMRAFVVADSCIKTRQSPYRAVYDAARANWADRDTSDGHKHAHALRLVAKAILKDIFKQSTTTSPPRSFAPA